MEYIYIYEYMNLNYGRDFWIPLKLGNACIIGQTIRQKRRVSISQAMMGMTWACQVVRKERSFSNLQIRWGAKNTKGLGWFPIWGTKNPGQKNGGWVGKSYEKHQPWILDYMIVDGRLAIQKIQKWHWDSHVPQSASERLVHGVAMKNQQLGMFKDPLGPHLWGQVMPAKNEDPNFHLAKTFSHFL